MAKSKKQSSSAIASTAAPATPKDEVALKSDVADSLVNSSARRVRISDGSPADRVKTRRKSSGKAAEGPVTEVLGDGPGDSEKKFSPKHKKQPEKGVLKASTSKKRKAAEEASDEEGADESRPSTSKAANFVDGKAPNGKEAAADEALQNDNGDDDDNDDDGELDFLAGFESGSDDEDGEDSSDEEGPGEPVNVKDLPQPKKGRVSDNKKVKKEKNKPGVIYLGRIPHGFHEDEMNSYFSQFGEVTRLRLSRNKRTGASKHYAFIEFEHASVAQIVSETMDNYLLHGHILQCKVVPPEEVHPKLWVGANKKFRPVPKGRVERLKHNAPKTDEQKKTISTRLVKREEAKRQKLRELGIEYDFDGYAKSLPDKQKKDQGNEKKALEAAKRLESQVKKDAKLINKKSEPRQKRVKKA